MNSEVLLLGVIVGGVNYLFRYLPLRLRVGHARPARRGPVSVQNATGNWIKVVQRLPVRIELDEKQLAEHPLRIGLSTLVEVNTTDRDGEMLASQVRSSPVYESNAREIALDPVNKLIDEIIQANAG